LADLAPTLLALLGIKQPELMTGKSLLAWAI
jgi:bisphosphoglycerate-independent phosphoglycerate mutase (AlkP superfamily)